MQRPDGIDRLVRFFMSICCDIWEIICILCSGFQRYDKQLSGLEQLLSAPGLKGQPINL